MENISKCKLDQTNIIVFI